MAGCLQGRRWKGLVCLPVKLQLINHHIRGGVGRGLQESNRIHDKAYPPRNKVMHSERKKMTAS